MQVDFSKDDLDLLRTVISEARRRPRNAPRGQTELPRWPQSPPMLIVRTPAAGIPALSDVGTGTGTGTGTSIDPTNDDMVEPGSAECKVFRVIDDLLQWAGFSITVLNANPFVISGWLFVSATQDRFGRWWAPTLPLRVGQCP